MLITAQKRGRRLGWRENYVGWMFCLPIIVGILAFTLVPILMSLYSTGLKWTGLKSIFDADSVGFKNFYDVFAGKFSENFYKSLLNTVLMMLNIPVSLILGVLLAMGMNRKMAGAKTFRVLYYLPSITSVVAVTVLFQKLFDTEGTINQLLGYMGIEKIKWLTSPVALKVTINLLILWKGVGYSSLMYLAGLQSVSTDQIEASKIDGAGDFRRFIKIVMPALYPITFYLLVTGIMNGLQLFNEPFILVGYGPANSAMTSASFVYYYYINRNLGVAAVGAWALAVLVFAITALQLAVDNRKEKY